MKVNVLRADSTWKEYTADGFMTEGTGNLVILTQPAQRRPGVKADPEPVAAYAAGCWVQVEVGE